MNRKSREKGNSIALASKKRDSRPNSRKDISENPRSKKRVSLSDTQSGPPRLCDLQVGDLKAVTPYFLRSRLVSEFSILFHINGVEQSISSEVFLCKQVHKITIDGADVGEITWQNGLLAIRTKQKIDIALKGRVECAAIDIKTEGNITVDAALNPREIVRLDGADVSINNTIAMVKSMAIKANTCSLNSNVVAGHTAILANSVTIAKNKKLITPIAVINAKTFDNYGTIKSKLSLNVEAISLFNEGNITTHNLHIETSGELNNKGKLYGSRGAEIQASRIVNNGRIQSNADISVQTYWYHSENTAHLVAKNVLKLQADEVHAAGEIKAKAIYIKSEKLTLETQLNARKLNIDVGNLVLANAIVDLPERSLEECEDVLVAGAHSLCVRNNLVVAKDATLQLNQTVLDIQGRTEVVGGLYMDNSQLSLHDMNVSGKLTINYCDVRMQNSIINEKGLLNSTYSQWQGCNLFSQGHVDINSCGITCNGIEISSGKASFEFNNMELTQQLLVQQQSFAAFTQCSVQVNKIEINGNAEVRQSELRAQAFDLSGKLLTSETNIAIAKDITVNQGATLELRDKNKLTANVVHSSGVVNMNGSLLIAEGFDHQAGSLSIKQSTMNLNEGFKQQKGASIVIEQSTINAPKLLAEGDVSLTRSRLQGQYAKFNGAMNFDHAEIQFDEQFVVGEKAKLIGNHTKLNLNLCQWLGSVNLENTELNAKRSAGKGQISIKRSSIAVDAEFHGSSKSTMRLVDTQISSEKTVFSGAVFADATQIDADFYQQQGIGKFKRSKIAAKKGISVNEQAEFRFKKGKIESDDHFVMACNSTIEESEVDVKDYSQEQKKLNAKKSTFNVKNTLYIDKNASAILKKVTLSTKHLRAGGDFEACGSTLDTHAMSFDKEAKFIDSTIKNKESLIAAKKSKISLTHCTVETHEAELQGQASITEMSRFKVLNEVNLRQMAELNLESQSTLTANDFADYGHASVTHSTLEIDRLNLARSLRLLQGATVSVKQLDVLFSSELAISESEFKGVLATINGDVTLENSTMDCIGEVNMLQDAHFILDEATFAAENLNHAGKITAKKNAKINITDLLVTKTASEITGEDIAITASQFEHFGSLHDMQKASVEVDNLNVYGSLNGHDVTLLADNALFIQGKISGDIIKVDGNYVTNNGQISANKSLTSTSLVFTNVAGGMIYTPNATFNTAVYLNAGGVVSACNLSKNTLIDLNFGLECPSLPSSFEDVFSPTKLFNVAKTAVSAVYAPLGAAMGIAQNLYHLPGQIQDIIKQGKSLRSKGWDKFRFRDTLPAAMSVKNVAVSVANNAQGLYKLGKDAYKEFKRENTATVPETDKNSTPDENNKGPEKSTKDKILSFGKEAAEVFMPMHTSESVFSVNGGVQASYNINKTDFVSVNLGEELALNRMVHNSSYQYNAGDTLAKEVSLNARYFKSDGVTLGSDNLHFEFGEAEIGDNATFNAEGRVNGTVAGDFKVKGQCKLTHNHAEGTGKVAIKGKLIVENENADVTFSGIEVTANEAQLLQQINIIENSTLDTKHTHIGPKGALMVDNTSKQSSDTTINEGINCNSGIMARLIRDETNKVIGTGKMNSYENHGEAVASFSGNAAVENFQNNAVVEGSGGAVLNFTVLKQEENGQTTLTGNTSLLGQSADIRGKMIAEGAKVSIEELKSHQDSEVLLSEVHYTGKKMEIAGKFKIESDTEVQATEVTTQKSSVVEVKDSHLFTATLHNGGVLLGDNATVKAEALSNSGNAKFSKSVLEADTGNINGEFTMSDNSLFKVQRTTIEDVGKVRLVDSQHQGKSLLVKGEYVTQGQVVNSEQGKHVTTSVYLAESMQIAEGGNADMRSTYLDAAGLTVEGKMQSTDLSVKVVDANVKGKWVYEGELKIDASNRFTTEQQSHMQGEGDAKFTLAAKQEAMEGKHTGRTMHFNVEELQDVKGLIQAEGRFANIQMDNLGVKTQMDVVLLENKRGAGTSFDIEATAINVDSDWHTAGLKLKATKGDININANVSANANQQGGDGNIYYSSERDVNIMGKGRVVEHKTEMVDVNVPFFGSQQIERKVDVEHTETLAVKASGNVVVDAKGKFYNKDAQLI
ncbi:MAG: hypothetical protein M3R00_03200, partial [Pseudomonadota bacterium]|nr:hypothetical protein [Pseudomonadota bacterium]